MADDWTDQDYVETVHEIDEKGEGLNDWEVGFIGRLINQRVKFFSEKQKAQIKRIYEEKF